MTDTNISFPVFLKLAEVQKRTTLSRSAIYRKIEEGSFPKQVTLSPGRVAWHESDVVDWCLSLGGQQNV